MAEKVNGILKCVGVIGAGVFGSTIANLLARNADQVIIYSRRKDFVDRVNSGDMGPYLKNSEKIKATNDPAKLAHYCTLIFPVLPSASFATILRSFEPYLKPSHIMIHGTKGLHIKGMTESEILTARISRDSISTMSELIKAESNVLRVGCLSGPNLAKEILAGQPTATVIASEFEEVVEIGQRALSSDQFFVFGSKDLVGAELAGALKNIIALGVGMLDGMGYGKNMQAMLITRGLREVIYFGKCMGSTSHAFLGTAGIGDIIATCTSDKSRNFQVGQRLARGETLLEILDSMEEVAEGVRTLKIARQLAKHYDIHVPITKMLYDVVFEEYQIERAIQFLMRYPFAPDVDFL